MVSQAERGRAIDALWALPNNLPREEWIRVGIAAIASGLSINDLVEWSRGAPNFKSDADVVANFRHVKPDGGVGPGTLFKLAHEHGWRGGSRDELSIAERRGASAPPPSPRVATAPTSTADGRAQALWAAFDTPATHPYVEAKGGVTTGLRVVRTNDALEVAGTRVAGWLAVPALDAGGLIQTLQFVAPPDQVPALKADGRKTKLNLPGPLAGAYFVVGTTPSAETKTLFIVEGLGQAWAVSAAANASVVVSFGAGLFGRAAVDWRERCPYARIILVPDRGKEAVAYKAASAVGGSVAEMPAGEPDNFDANDLAQRDGVSVLRVLLERNGEAPCAPRRYRLKTAQELVTDDGLEWRVKGVLPTQGLAQIYGDSRAGKSFLVLDMAAAIVEGETWFGHRVTEAPVVYVGLEGEGGLAQRVKAWELRRERPIASTLRFFVRQPFDIRRDVDDLAAVVAQGAVIFIDTQNRAAPDADENSSREMGAILEGAKRLQTLTRGLVVLVTHKAKHAEAGKGPRGHSSQLAAMDAVLEVSRPSKDERTWRVEKAKDAEDGTVHGFRLEVVSLGIDADGDDVSSCVVVPVESASDERGSVNAPSKLSVVARAAFDEVSREDGLAHIDEWRLAFRKRWPGSSEQGKAKAFERARKELRDTGVLHEVGGRVGLRSPADDAMACAS